MQNSFVDSQITSKGCPVCGSPTGYWLSKFNDGVAWRIHRCGKCGYAFINPRPSEAWLANWYSESGHHASELQLTDHVSLDVILAREEKYPNSTLDARRMIATIRFLSKGDKRLRLLDVGCGYGFFSKEALAQGFAVTPIEVASNERAIATEMLGIEPIATSFEDFPPPSTRFDAVLMSQILEHACDINLWMEKVRGLLHRGGIVAIALPNFNSFLRFILREREPYIVPPAHLNYFSPSSLGKLMKKHSFTIEAVQHVSRIPRSTFEKRLPGTVPGLHALIWGMSRAMLGIIDSARLGMIINLYARKK